MIILRSHDLLCTHPVSYATLSCLLRKELIHNTCLTISSNHFHAKHLVLHYDSNLLLCSLLRIKSVANTLESDKMLTLTRGFSFVDVAVFLNIVYSLLSFYSHHFVVTLSR